MDKRIILILAVPFTLMLIISVGFPFYCKSVMNHAGEKKLPLARKKQIISHWVAPIASYILVILPFFINMGRFGMIIPYCGVLGLYIVIKESTFSPLSGVYENIIINGSTLLKISDIQSIEDTAQDNVLVAITKRKARIQLVFDNSNEALEVKKILTESFHS